MARHRNVRSMNYTDEYDGYDDVYGHSVEEDFCVSPSEAAFMYDREGSKNQLMGAFIKDIAEEDEQEPKLLESETKVLESCIAELKLVLGSSTSQQEMVKVLLDNKLDVDKALNILLDNGSSQLKQVERKDKGDKLQLRSKQFNIPKLDTLKIKYEQKTHAKDKDAVAKYNTYINPQKNFMSLSDLSNSHLKNVKTIINVPNLKVSKNSEDMREYGDLHIAASNARNHFTDSTLNIDLTKALKKNTLKELCGSGPKKFDYLNVTLQGKFKDGLNCLMDISFILDYSSNISKEASAFGKILCCKYKRIDPIISKNRLLSKFSFEIFSPDDMIHSYLKM